MAAADESVFPTVSPIFIVGTGRSGTTLLYSMLNAHPYIALTNELRFFGEMIKVRDLVPSLEQVNDVAVVFALLEERTQEFKHQAQVDAVEAEVLSRWTSIRDRTYPRLLLCLLQAYAHVHGATRYGDKSPIEIRSLTSIFATFPRARVIAMVRDPRAVVASRLKMSWTSNDVVVNTLKWKIDQTYLQEFQEQHPDETGLLTVRYADLVTEPERELRRVCAFIDEPYDPAMLTFERHAAAYTRQSGESFTQTFKPLTQASLDRWQEELSAEKTLIIDLLAGDTLNTLGCEPTQPSLGTWLRMPFVFLAECWKYAVYKSAEIRSRRRRGDTLIIGDSTSLHRKLFDALRR